MSDENNFETFPRSSSDQARADYAAAVALKDSGSFKNRARQSSRLSSLGRNSQKWKKLFHNSIQ